MIGQLLYYYLRSGGFVLTAPEAAATDVLLAGCVAHAAVQHMYLPIDLSISRLELQWNSQPTNFWF